MLVQSPFPENAHRNLWGCGHRACSRHVGLVLFFEWNVKLELAEFGGVFFVAATIQESSVGAARKRIIPGCSPILSKTNEIAGDFGIIKFQSEVKMAFIPIAGYVRKSCTE